MAKTKTEVPEPASVDLDVLATVIVEHYAEKTINHRFHEIENDVGISRVLGDPYIDKTVVGEERKLKILICKA